SMLGSLYTLFYFHSLYDVLPIFGSIEFSESNEDPKTISDKDDLLVHDLVKKDGPILCPEPELAPLNSKSESSDKWNDWNDDQWKERKSTRLNSSHVSI